MNTGAEQVDLVTVADSASMLPDNDWQVIFRKGGIDYCRERRPASEPLGVVRAWAKQYCEFPSLTAHITRDSAVSVYHHGANTRSLESKIRNIRYLMPWRRHIRYLITGHPRCGTTSAAGICQQLGIDVRDEEVGKDGISSWMMAVDDPWNPFGVGRLSRSRNRLIWDYLILVVRDLKEAVPSVILEDRYSPQSCSFRHKHILKQTGLDLGGVRDEVARAVLSITSWIGLICQQSPDLTFRIENQQDKLRSFLRKTARLPEACPALANVHLNGSKPYSGIMYEKPKVGPDEWRRLDVSVRDAIENYCARFGYDPAFCR